MVGLAPTLGVGCWPGVVARGGWCGCPPLLLWYTTLLCSAVLYKGGVPPPPLWGRVLTWSTPRGGLVAWYLGWGVCGVCRPRVFNMLCAVGSCVSPSRMGQALDLARARLNYWGNRGETYMCFVPFVLDAPLSFRNL